MSRGADSTQWSAQQTLSYINGLIAADENDDEEHYKQTLYTALSISYEYLTSATKRKVTWSLSLQKLAYEFIELAFQNNMHSSIKDVFKSYRALTQGQYSQSLKYVLEHYRDKKLEVILEEEIHANELDIIRSMPNIQLEELSSDIILDSIKPEVKQRKIQLKNKLKIVWEGYKSIVETVRVNQKLQDVYMATLNKIFDFVDRYNRVHEFKAFCKTLRSGLQNAFNKRDKAEQQKSIYIDIEKTEVNNRNIEIRMEQFKIATKLGLWQEGFQVLEDINTLMKVRKAPLKNSLKCQYYENLALLFKKSNYWHYHAFAFYNYYLSYLTKPKITVQQKTQLSDKLLLSVLCIPPATLQSNQSKQSQEKICSMMISSTKIPDKNQFVQLMISKGVLENSSEGIKQLWNFMFLQFNLSSLNKGLGFLKGIKGEYNEFKDLIETILIYKQLTSIAEVYQRIKLQSLQKLIPLPKQKIQKILILCHRQKIIDFTFDESQGIVIFQDKTQQINPYEQFFDIFVDVAIEKEKERTKDVAFIKQQALKYISEADNFIWKIRQYKIDQYKKKLKKPMQQLRKREIMKEKEERDLRDREQFQRKIKEAETMRKNEETQKILATKKIIINDIISIKETRVVRILKKKIEFLTDQEIDNLSIQVLNEHLQQTKKKIANNKEAKLKKAFTYVDYIQRERRQLLGQKIKLKTQISEQENSKQIIQASKVDFDERKVQKSKLLQLANFIKVKVENELQTVNDKYDADLAEYKGRIYDNFKEKALAKARALYQENQKKKQQTLKQAEESQKMGAQQDKNANWSFSKARVQTKGDPSTVKRERQSAPTITLGRKKATNVFQNLQGIEEEKEKGSSKKVDNQQWSFNKKKGPEKNQKIQKTQVKEVVNEKQHKAVFTPPPVAAFVPPPPSTTTNVNASQVKKDEKPKGRKFIDANDIPVKKQEKKQQSKPEVKKGKRF